MKLDGKKVIALGERDGVPGPAIARPGSTAIALRRTSGSRIATQVPAGQSKASPSTVNSARPLSTT